MSVTMTKGERSELGQLIRKRERVLKAAANERSSKLMAEFDAQCAQIYSFDDDAIWKKAHELAAIAVAEAQEAVQARCKELGIPPEFAPGLNVYWHGRGQNAAAGRRVELRRMAKARVEVIEQEAKTRIERMSLEAQTAVISSGIESPAAKHFSKQCRRSNNLCHRSTPVRSKAFLISNTARGRGGPAGYLE